MVNVEAIAARRGLKIAEEKSSTCEHYANMVTVEVHTTSGSTLVAGSSIQGRTYLTRVDDYWLEIEPADSYMLFTEHKDRPGMVGIVGTLLGGADINISQMHVSSGVRRGGNAMMVLCLDVPIPDECYKQILAVTDMYKSVIVKLVR
jgi:D-3-phosphoglycerate dehydrogenase